MSFKAFRSEQFSHSHENFIFDKLYEALNKTWGDKEDPLYLFGNFCVGNTELDALILKRNAIIVVDFKNYGGKIKFSANNYWYADTVQIKGGNKKNPLVQIRENRYDLLKALKQIEFKSSPNLGHITGLCLFHQPIEFDESQLTPDVSLWFYVTDFQNSLKVINAIVSPQINLTKKDIESLITFFDVAEYTPDEIPAEPEKESVERTVLYNSLDELEHAAVEKWLNSSEIKVLSVSGTDYSFKSSFLINFYTQYSVLKEIKILSPNRFVSRKYQQGHDVPIDNIQNWLYDLDKKSQVDNKICYPVKKINPEEHIDILVILDAHLCCNDFMEKDNIRLGSGYLLDDLIALFKKRANLVSLENSVNIPKILLIGDKYQLLRGSKSSNLLLCRCFEKFQIKYDCFELSETITNADNTDKALFQEKLIKQINDDVFIQLPETNGETIFSVDFNSQIAQVTADLKVWPKLSICLCSTHDKVNKINRYIVSKIHKDEVGRQKTDSILKPNDVILIKNNFLSNLWTETDSDVLLNSSDMIYSYSFARVLDCKPSFEKSKNLNGRKDPVVLKFASAVIELEDGSIHNIVYSVDFLNAEKPELPLDYHLCLNIWAKEYEKEHKYVDLKNPLTNPDNSALIKNDNPFLNIAFVRYGYAITVFNSQKLLPFEHVFLDASKSHDTENPATQSYFRMLYTASCAFSDTLKIHHYNFFDYTDFSNSNWNFSDVQLGIIQSKKRYYIVNQNDSKIPEKVPLLNQDINLIKLFRSISAQLLRSDWRILSVVQHNYLEQYILEKHDTKIQISLHYNKKYEFTFGANKVLSGNENELYELMSLLETTYVIQNTFIKNAVSCFETFLNNYQIKLVDVIEHLYKAVVTISHLDDKAELELDIPSRISQKGIISNIKVRKVSSQAILDFLKAISND